MKKPSEPFVLISLCIVAVVVICFAGLAYEYGLFSSQSSQESTPSVISTTASSQSSLPRYVDVNVASVDQLAQVPGMDRETARKIVTYRELNGPFSELPQLAKIPGIDQKKLLEVIPFLSCVEYESTP